ncbi:hypothetical protein MAR_010313 [Mya arenaria]|uniref:Uncharacterized protein n=1 Tax=Mya arenaria TaxID=6604 RepID=A0ABY7E177_MYAAR|nr:hypothetical protein MAR_010313 [Mya arenaria]
MSVCWYIEQVLKKELTLPKLQCIKTTARLCLGGRKGSVLRKESEAGRSDTPEGGAGMPRGQGEQALFHFLAALVHRQRPP